MSGVTIVVVGALLFAVLLILGAIMVWQEGRERTMAAPPTYVIDDAISVAWDHLDADACARVKKAGVRRIIEWEVYYLQGLADKKAARAGITVVAGGDDQAVAYVRDQLARRGHDYAADDIRAVLEGEAVYLESIGAIGEIANEDV